MKMLVKIVQRLNFTKKMTLIFAHISNTDGLPLMGKPRYTLYFYKFRWL